MFWLPPVLFSTTTGWFQVAWRFCASVRAMVSGDPPGGSGTTSRTARSGYPWARDASEKAAASSPTIQRFTFPSSDGEGAVYLLARTGIRCPSAHFTGRGGWSMLYKRTLIAAALLALAAPSWSQDMKDGKAMVDATCNSCHPLTARIGSGYDERGWKTVMRMMI